MQTLTPHLHSKTPARQGFVLYRPMGGRNAQLLTLSAPKICSGTELSSVLADQGECFILAPFNPVSPVLSFPIEERTGGEPEALSDLLRERCKELSATFTDNALKARCESANARVFPAYSAAFGRFKAALTAGDFEKLVLARPLFLTLTRPLWESFAALCERYPRAFCYLACLPDTGIFMGASPERLATCDGVTLETMSLAGTMPGSAQQNYTWSQKNLREQRLVTAYIETSK